MNRQIQQLIDLTDPTSNTIYNMSLEEARKTIWSGLPEEVFKIKGSFAIVAGEGEIVKIARSLDRPIRYFLAKRKDGPMLIVASRIDAIHDWLKKEDLQTQFHPTYTRMVPAYHIVELHLIGCPDPDPNYTRFFTPKPNSLPPDVKQIGEIYISALANEIRTYLSKIPNDVPIGVCFSGGIDSGAVFLMTYWLMQKMDINLGRLKAFTLDLGNGSDVDQAYRFLKALDLELFLETMEADPSNLDVKEAIKVVEDYKQLDVECATMSVALLKQIRKRYPDWQYLMDGDGGDENLKDYPIEENPELTIRSVINNPLLYQEGWGVGKIKHSLTYSGGLSRSYTRTYAPARYFGFMGFSPFTQSSLVEIAAAIPYEKLVNTHEQLYSLKGEIVSHGIRAITGLQMPVFAKKRFQHGAFPLDSLRKILPYNEADYRAQFLKLYD